MEFLAPFIEVYTLDNLKFLLEGFAVTLKGRCHFNCA